MTKSNTQSPPKPNTGPAIIKDAATGTNPGTNPDADALQLTVDYCIAEIGSAQGHMARAFSKSVAINRLREMFTPQMMKPIMGLMNSNLGFLTDRGKPDKNGKIIPDYSESVVKECVIEALLRGLYVDGNEFNIIKGKCLAVKNGLSRLVREYPGLTDLKVNLNPPTQRGTLVIVDCVAEWKLNGITDRLEKEIPIKSYASDGVDLLMGKAESKALKAIYGRITGSYLTVDIDDDDVVTAPGTDSQWKESSVKSRYAKSVKNIASEQNTAQPKTDSPAANSVLPPQNPPPDQGMSYYDRAVAMLSERDDITPLAALKRIERFCEKSWPHDPPGPDLREDQFNTIVTHIKQGHLTRTD